MLHERLTPQERLLELEDVLDRCIKNWRDVEMSSIEELSKEEQQIQGLIWCVNYAKEAVVDILNVLD